jgi:hypothetical protein
MDDPGIIYLKGKGAQMTSIPAMPIELKLKIDGGSFCT